MKVTLATDLGDQKAGSVVDLETGAARDLIWRGLAAAVKEEAPVPEEVPAKASDAPAPVEKKERGR